MKLSGFKGLVGMVAASWLGLTGLVVQPAGAEQQAIGANETEPPPPPGTFRLISIGPQALVREDDHGHLTMVDDPEPQRSKLKVAGIMLGAMTAGVVIAFYGDLGPGVIGGPTNRNAGGPNNNR